MIGWIALHRSDETLALMENHPHAFLLLCQIALRAKRRDCPIRRLKARQAFIGDWKEAGLPSEKSYRLAKETLKRCGLATFHGTNKGTVATLRGTSVFSLMIEERETMERGEPAAVEVVREHPGHHPSAAANHDRNGGAPEADKGRTEGGQGATNKKERIKKEESISLPQTGEGERESHDPIPWEKKIYEAYPRKVGKAAGLKAIHKALRSRPPESLLERTRHHAKTISWQEPRYIPHPDRWFNERRFDDDPADWENPESRPTAGAAAGDGTTPSAMTVVIGGRTYVVRS